MKFIFRFLIIILLGYFLPFYLPWWILIIICFLVGFFIPGNSFTVFNAGFLGGGVVWMGLSFKLDSDTQSIMSEKIVQLMPFDDATLLIIIAGLIGAIVGGFSAVSGGSLRSIFIKKKQTSLYS